jgi:light-regulated signal transduction histidine kinase (bacteriophytochrome)
MSASTDTDDSEPSTPPRPGFGEADLSNCEREEIHLAGSIQPHGALLLVRDDDLAIVQASANAATFLGRAREILGESLDGLGGNLAPLVRSHLADDLTRIPVAIRCRVAGLDLDLDGSLHRPAGGGLIIELEVAEPTGDVSEFVCDALRSISAAPSLRSLCDETARIFKDLAGYDRVMVYRFDEEGHGEVYAEEREPQLEAFLANRYPASDIPQIARRLYERNRVRLLVDVEYEPVPLVPAHSPITGGSLDMSLCTLRSMSPIHIQYLKNMGVCATLVASLLVGGRLWGLVACHHYSPRHVHYQTRVVSELLAEAVSTRIAALESFAQSQAELSVRRLEQQMVEAITTNGDWEGALFDNPQVVLQPLRAGGVALLRHDEVITAGEVPGTRQLREIGDWLNQRCSGSLLATASLGLDEPRFAPLTPVAAGLLATPVSGYPTEYLVWFRPERVRTVIWGGNPHKAVEVGDDPSQLSPRRSFAKWYEQVEGTSDPWTPNDLNTARLIGESVADVVQQFRAVRFLIVQNQLSQVRRQVRSSHHPVIIGDPTGAILLTNEALDRLLGTEGPPRHLDRILPLFADPEDARLRLQELREAHRSWHGEVLLDPQGEGDRPFLVRADPILSAPDETLGFVLIFNDLGARKAADEARRRFQENILEQHRIIRIPVASKEDLVLRDLMVSLVGNAQLAALEITDHLEVSQVPDMLASLQSSVARTTELLQHLAWYTSRSSGGPKAN